MFGPFDDDRLLWPGRRRGAVRSIEQGAEVVDFESQALAARMIEDKIRDEWIRIGATADCRAIVNYSEETGEWEARPARDNLTVK